MRRLIAFALAFLSWFAAASAHVERVEIWDPGIYTTSTVGVTPVPDSLSGYSTTVDNIKLKSATTNVPGCLNVDFGFQYRLVGTPGGELDQVKIIVYAPEPGVRRPDGQVRHTASGDFERLVGADSYSGYSFDDPWEIVPGTWRFEIWLGGRKMAEQSFNVSKECGDLAS